MDFFSFLSKFILFFALYFSILWVLILLNSSRRDVTSLKNWPKVSIVIPAYNEERGIERTIRSALDLDYKGEIEIIAVNDASKDSTIDIMRKYADKIKIIDKKKNGGKARGLNDALAIVSGEYFAVLDADSKVSKTALSTAISKFGSKNLNIGAVICRMKPENESGNILERIQLMEYMMVGLFRSFASHIRLLHLTPGVLSVYKTQVLKSVSGFDPKNLTEDFEVGVKIRKAGYLVDYSYDSEVYTRTPSSMKVFLSQRIRWSRGFIQTHKKHKDLFFNRKHGAFGIYQFPMNVLGPIIYFFAIFSISYNVYRKLFEFGYKLIHTPGLIEWFSFGTFKDFFLAIDPRVDFMIAFSLSILLFLFYSAFRFYEYRFLGREPFKRLFALFLYIMVYNYIYIYIWIVSLVREFRREGYDWGTK